MSLKKKNLPVQQEYLYFLSPKENILKKLIFIGGLFRLFEDFLD